MKYRLNRACAVYEDGQRLMALISASYVKKTNQENCHWYSKCDRHQIIALLDAYLYKPFERPMFRNLRFTFSSFITYVKILYSALNKLIFEHTSVF